MFPLQLSGSGIKYKLAADSAPPLQLLGPLCVGSKETNAACCHGGRGDCWFAHTQGREKRQSSQREYECVVHGCVCIVVPLETTPFQ